MSSELVIESGLQVVTRLFNRPSVQDLDNDLFFNKLENTDVVEIRGTITSGVNALLTKLIAKCILPLQYDGLGIDVLLINSENQFQVSYLHDVIKDKISNILGPINVDKHVQNVLNNLKIINCYNQYQFCMTINSLDDILLRYKKVSSVVVDSITAYYWQQKEELSYDSFLLKMLNIIRKTTLEFKVLTLYTKQFNFESKKKTIDWDELIKILRYQICLNNNEDSDDFICHIKSGNDEKELYYKIDNLYFTWIKQEN